jgi:hypothetical protein
MYIFIGIPCYSGNLQAQFVESLTRLLFTLKDANVPHVVEYITTESLISRARNTLTALFYSQLKYTHLLFLDADLIFSEQAIISLLNANKELSGCPYPKKKINWQKVNKLIDDKEDIEKNQPMITDINYNLPGGKPEADSSMIVVKDIPTGCMVIKRSVITTLMLNYPERKFKNNVAGYDEQANDYFYDFFATGVVDGIYLSEDYYFCHLCRQVNIKCWLEINYTFGHIGSQTFYGNLAKQLHKYGANDELNQDIKLLSKIM